MKLNDVFDVEDETCKEIEPVQQQDIVVADEDADNTLVEYDYQAARCNTTRPGCTIACFRVGKS